MNAAMGQDIIIFCRLRLLSRRRNNQLPDMLNRELLPNTSLVSVMSHLAIKLTGSKMLSSDGQRIETAGHDSEALRDQYRVVGGCGR